MRLNMQRTFNTVLMGLRAQGKQSFSKTLGCCTYRGPYKTKCAAGLLIPDEAFHSDMNQAGDVGMVVAAWPTTAKYFGKMDSKHLRLVEDLQVAHDSLMPERKGGSLEKWEARMKEIACEYKLKYTEPTVKEAT